MPCTTGFITLFKNAGENKSESYTRFRFAEDIADSDNLDLTRKFLINLNIERGTHAYSYYTMPVYENSLYFYFGLKDGNTAIDRLYTDYFSECTTQTEHENGSVNIGTRIEEFEQLDKQW